MEDHTRETALRLAQDAVLTLRVEDRTAAAIVKRAEAYLAFLRGDSPIGREPWQSKDLSGMTDRQRPNALAGNTEMRTGENIGIGVGIPYLRGGPFA